MSNKYFKQVKPFIVPTTDGKSIKEHFGLASTQEDRYSLAHMIAPPDWSEPHTRRHSLTKLPLSSKAGRES